MSLLFLRFELSKIANYFKTKTLAKSITVFLFLGVFSFIALGIYGFFVTGFRFVNFEAFEGVQMALNLFLYEVFLVVLLSVIALSALISSIFTLFRGKGDDWIMSSPSYKVLPRIVLMKGVLGSLLPTVVLFVPMILAFARVYELHLLEGLLLFVGVIALIIFVNALILLLLVLLGSIYYRFSDAGRRISFTLSGLVGLFFSVIFSAFFMIWKSVRDIDFVSTFRADIFSDALSLEVIASHFTALPTHPLAMQLLSFQTGNFTQGLFYLSITLVLAFLATLAWWNSWRFFYPLWQVLSERQTFFQSKKEVTSPFFSYTFRGGDLAILFKKELLVMSRNMKGILWLLFLSLIWVLQIGASTIIDNNLTRHQIDVSEKFAILQALQFLIAVYFISSFSLRFVFPSFSSEKRTSWILGSAPISFAKIFYGKTLFFGFFFSVIAIIMSYLNSLVLDSSLAYGALTMTLLVSATFLIVVFAMTIGALFPNRETDDPEAASTSMPGLFFTGASLLFGAFCSLLLYTSSTTTSHTPLLLGVMISVTLSLLILLGIPKTKRFVDSFS